MRIKNIHSVPMYTRFGRLNPGDEMAIPKEALKTIGKEVQFNQSQMIEDYCRLVIKPRSWWIPNLIWRYLVKKMISLQYIQGEEQ